MLVLHALAVLVFGLAKMIPFHSLFVTFSVLSNFVEGFSESVIVCCALMMSFIYFDGQSSYQVAFMLGYQLS